MRRGLRGAYRRELVGVGLVSVGASLAACNLIAGINEGVLVDAGADGGGVTKHEGGGPNDGSGRTDAGRDGGGDAAKDARRVDGGLTDATMGADVSDAGVPQVPLTCSVISGSRVTVADLGLGDAGAATFASVYVAPNGGANGFTVLTTIESMMGAGSHIVAYTVANGSASPPTPYPGGLITVNTRADRGIEAVAGYRAEGGSQFGLQLLTGSSASSLVAGGDFGVLTGSTYDDLRIADIPSTSSIGYVSVTSPSPGSGTPSTLSFGLVDPDGGPAAAPAYESSMGLGITNNGAFVATTGGLYALLNNVQRPDASLSDETVFAATTALADAGLEGIINPPTNGGAILGARTSATDPSKVVILAGTIAPTTGKLIPCGTTVPSSSIVGLTLCGSGFTFGASVVVTDINLGGGGGSTAWNPTTNDFVSLGPNGNNSAFSLYWLGADAHIVVLQPSFVPIGKVLSSAIQFDGFIGENTESNFDVAWVEQNGAAPQQLFAATITCQPSVAGD